MKVFRASLAEKRARSGYTASYVADIMLKRPAESLGMIFVEIPQAMKTAPHLHEEIEEVFVALTSLTLEINEERMELNAGDVVVAEAGEVHRFHAQEGKDARVLAIKVPNIKDDKVSLG